MTNRTYGYAALLAAFVMPNNLVRPAPAPPVGRAPSYYPTTAATQWAVDCTAGGRTEIKTYVITGVLEKDDARVVSVGLVEADGKVHPCDSVSVSDRGIVRLTVPDLDLAPPLVVLKLPHRPGNR